MDADIASLTDKDGHSAVEALSPMDIAHPAQLQNVDMTQNVDVNLGDVTQLRSNKIGSPATENVACDKPAGVTIADPLQSSLTSTDVEVKYSIRESNHWMEVGSHENAGACEEVCSEIKEEVNGDSAATCQSMNENNPSLCMTTEDGEDTEPSPTQPGGNI